MDENTKITHYCRIKEVIFVESLIRDGKAGYIIASFRNPRDRIFILKDELNDFVESIFGAR